jgi:hypothetical protein
MSGSKVHSKLLGAGDCVLWDEAVEGAGRGTLFHQALWLKSFDKPMAVIGCYNDAGALVGGMPLSYQRMAGLTIARPPYLTPYLGPVVFAAEGQYHRMLTLEKDIAASVIDCVQTFCDFVRIPLAPGDMDTQPFKQRGFSVDIEHTYVVELGDMDQVWKGLNQDRRRKIKKGYEEGLTCELSDDLDRFFPLLAHSLITHGKRLSQGRVEEVRRWYEPLRAKNRARMLQIRDSCGRLCTAAILVWDSKRGYYLLSGMDRDISSGNSMTLLLWECMRFCHEEIHVKEFDFDGSEVPSVELFFRGFGGRLTPRFSVMWGRPYVGPVRLVWKSIAAIRGLKAHTRSQARV